MAKTIFVCTNIKQYEALQKMVALKIKFFKKKPRRKTPRLVFVLFCKIAEPLNSYKV